MTFRRSTSTTRTAPSCSWSAGARRTGPYVRRLAACAPGAAASRRRTSSTSTLPLNVGEVLSAYPRILVPELNTGQLVRELRAEFLVPAEGLSKVEGQPFQTAQIEQEIERRL